MLDLRQDGPDVTFSVRVQPRASKDEIAGFEGGVLKLRLKAPPVEGKANEACLRFLASVFELKRSQLEIAKGSTSRHKVIRIKGIQAQYLRERMLPFFARR